MTWTRCSHCAEMVTVDDLARNGRKGRRRWCKGCESDRVVGTRKRGVPVCNTIHAVTCGDALPCFTIGERCA